MGAVSYTVSSRDGTPIVYEEWGSGPPLVLVHGGISDRTYWAPVIPALAQRFTVFSVDRRGHGDSGDIPPYVIDREFEDVAAVVEAIDGPVYLLGHSYGAICALEAALRTAKLGILVLYEPPFGMNGAAALPEDFIEQVESLVAAGEREAAVAFMMADLVGLPAQALEELRCDTAAWQPMVDTVHTLPRELRAVSTLEFDAGRYSGLDVPTVLLVGTLSAPEFHEGVGLVHDTVPGSRLITMQGVDHEAVTTGPHILTATLMDVLAPSFMALRTWAPTTNPTHPRIPSI